MPKKPSPPPDLPPPAVLHGTARTPLFWLLYEHHEMLTESWRHRRASWPEVCSWAAGRQVLDRDGKPVKPHAARKTWARVCDLKEQERADREAKQRPAPARSPTVKRVPPGAVPPVAAPVTNPPTRSQPTPAQADAGQEFDADQYIAEMRADLAHRSGRR